MKQVLKKLQKEEVNNNLKPFTGDNHKPRHYGYMSAAGMITGCGVVQLRGQSAYLQSDTGLKTFKAYLTKMKRELKGDGVGAIVCTLGQDYYYMEKRLLKAGFQEMAEYHNYCHEWAGEQYMQKMYILFL